MSKAYSFTDLLTLPSLSHLNEITMLHPSNDHLVADVLEQIGVDLDRGVYYVPSKHRNMQGNIVLSYQAVCELSLKKKWLNSGFFDLTDRLVVAGRTDPSLAREMSYLTGQSHQYSPDEDYTGLEEDDFPQDQLEPDWVFLQSQIAQLEEVRDSIRGNPYNAAGSLKTFDEYAEDFETKTFYEEKYDI